MDSGKNHEPGNSGINEARKGVIPSSNDKFVHTMDNKVFFGSAKTFDHFQLVINGRDDPESRRQVLSQRFPNAGLITELTSDGDNVRKFAVFGSSGDLTADNDRRFDSMPDSEKLKRDRVTANLLNSIYQGEIIFVTRENMRE